MSEATNLFDWRESLRKIEDVTPDKARTLLTRNVSNRSIKEAVVAEYAGAMRRGEWIRDAGEPLYVSPKGDLINGQHRLLAVIQADTTVGLPFVYNADPRTFLVADSGAKRSFSDVLHIKGVNNAKTISSIVSILMLYDQRRQFRIAGSSVGTNMTRLAFYENLDADEIQEAGRLGQRIAKAVPPITTALAGALWMLMRDVDRESADAFFEAVRTGADLTEDNPVMALRRVMGGLVRRQAPGTIVPPTMLAALFIKAFNYWREGREIHVLTWKAGVEPIPSINPPFNG